MTDSPSSSSESDHQRKYNLQDLFELSQSLHALQYPQPQPTTPLALSPNKPIPQVRVPQSPLLLMPPTIKTQNPPVYQPPQQQIPLLHTLFPPARKYANKRKRGKRSTAVRNKQRKKAWKKRKEEDNSEEDEEECEETPKKKKKNGEKLEDGLAQRMKKKKKYPNKSDTEELTLLKEVLNAVRESKKEGKILINSRDVALPLKTTTRKMYAPPRPPPLNTMSMKVPETQS